MKLEIIYIPLDKIELDESVENRGNIKDLESEAGFLAIVRSIRSLKSVMQPITINEISAPDEGEEFGKYRIIAGTKRYLAYKSLFQDLMLSEYATIPCIIRKVSQAEANIMKRHENQFRSNPSSENIFEFHVGAIPFLFNMGTIGDKQLNFKKGMEILTVYISLEVIQSKKKSPEASLKKREELKEVTRTANPMSVLKSHFRNVGETPLYFWKKRKVFQYDEGVKELYIQKRISFNMAKVMNAAVEDKIPGIGKLISLITRDKNIKKSEMTSRLERILNESSNKPLPKNSKKVDETIKTFRKMNKMLKSGRETLTIKNMSEIDEHTEKILKILKGDV